MSAESALRIAVLFPDLLGTYGDRGNATVLAARCRHRGQSAETVEVSSDEPVPTSCDLYLLGGGEDLAQHRAAALLESSHFRDAVEGGAAVLAVCAGLQILGTTDTESAPAGEHPGLGMLEATTRPGRKRAIGEVLSCADPELGLGCPVLTGFENHAGRTTLGPGVRPLGRLVRGVGNGDGTDGAVSGTIVATYQHGPVLARNPALADHLLKLATGITGPQLGIPDLPELRRERIAAAQRRRDVHARLVPRRWETPGIPHPRR
jgi:CobQ-like glutamine amidotransferase family enzyme